MQNEILMGKRIAEQRKKLGLTQNELADKLMISNKTISKWESDLGNPSLEFLPVLANLFNCSLDYLITGIDQNQEQRLAGCLPFIVGTDEDNNVITADLKDLGKMTIIGSTGSGKSSFLHNMIYNLLNNVDQSKFQLALIDTREVEFSMYYLLKNLITPLGKDETSVKKLLNKCKDIINQRIEFFKKSNYKDIDSFLEKTNLESNEIGIDFPRVVLMIDSLRGLIEFGKEYEELLDYIVEKGKDAGVYVVIGIQPFLNWHNYKKYVFPSRACGIVASEEDSIFCIGKAGAEYLSKIGLFYYFYNNQEVKLLQAPFHSEKEIDYYLEKNKLLLPYRGTKQQICTVFSITEDEE